MKCIINGKIVLKDKVYEGKVLLYDEKIIGIYDEAEKDKYAGAQIIDAKGNYVAPGLIDIHIHGYMGEDVSDGNIEGITKMSEEIVKNGVTSWCPTTMTVSVDEISSALDACRNLLLMSQNKALFMGAEVLGVHAEGPFISPEKKGAQNESYILKPDAQFVIDNKDIIKIITMAPETEGALKAFKQIKNETDVTISMGHSNAAYDEAIKGIDCGATHITHLFNAMSPINQRNPGLVGAGLLDSRVSCELIADTFHVSKHLYSLIENQKGDKLCLVTDCLRAAGLPEGEYVLGGQKFIVRGIECRLSDGVIAGSILKLNQAVKNFMDNTTLPINKIVAAASGNPAVAVKVYDRKGSLEKGKDADIIIADENFEILKTIIGGYIKYEKDEGQ